MNSNQVHRSTNISLHMLSDTCCNHLGWNTRATGEGSNLWHRGGEKF